MADGTAAAERLWQVREAPPDALFDREERLTEAVFDVTESLGGSFSAEHGIGQRWRDELIRRKPAAAVDLMRRVKAALDPAGILNPGKVL